MVSAAVHAVDVMFGRLWDSVLNNHFAMMGLCCLVPVLAIIAMKALGFSGWEVYALALVACVGSHFAIMALGKGGKKCH